MFPWAFLCQDIFTSPTQTFFFAKHQFPPSPSGLCGNSVTTLRKCPQFQWNLLYMTFHSESTHCSEAVASAPGDSFPQFCLTHPTVYSLPQTLSLAPTVSDTSHLSLPQQMFPWTTAAPCSFRILSPRSYLGTALGFCSSSHHSHPLR